MNPQQITIPRTELQKITHHAQKTFPNECCGILLGQDDQILQAIPSENIAPPHERPRRYIINPRHILETTRTAQQKNLDIIGYYHSHPNHPAIPSKTDIAESWPGVIYLIVSIDAQSNTTPRAWQMDGNTTAESPLIIE